MTDESGQPKETGKKRDGEVGYGKPPKHTQFGQPGANPSGNGRPKGSSLTAPILRALAKNPDEDGIGEAAGIIGDKVVAALKDLDTEKGTALLKAILDRVDGPVKQEVETEVTVHRTVHLVDRKKHGSGPPREPDRD